VLTLGGSTTEWKTIVKTYMFVALGLIAFGRPAVADTSSEEAAKKELKVLQGTWTVLYSEQNGERRRDVEEVKKMRLTIKDDNWNLEYHNNVKDKEVAKLKLDPTQKPKAVDLKFSEGLTAGETMLSIRTQRR
jgi:uncharacterized protein (TIGR03067 family)